MFLFIFLLAPPQPPFILTGSCLFVHPVTDMKCVSDLVLSFHSFACPLCQLFSSCFSSVCWNKCLILFKNHQTFFSLSEYHCTCLPIFYTPVKDVRLQLLTADYTQKSIYIWRKGFVFLLESDVRVSCRGQFTCILLLIRPI